MPTIETWWTDDRILSFVGILVSAGALFVGLWIAQEQNKAQELFSRKVLGTVPNIDLFKDRLCDLLKEVEVEEHRSHVYLMLYWLWFGADRSFPKHDISDISAGRSEVMRLVKARLAKGYPTTIVVYDHVLSQDKLIDFFHEILRYNSESGFKESGAKRKEITHDEVMALYSRYRDSLNQLLLDAKQHPSSIFIKEAEDIPALMCAVTGRNPCSLLLLFERSAIKGMAASGGFESYEPRMVDVVRNQIEVAAELCTDS